jgi:trans-aconitate methyltransferase
VLAALAAEGHALTGLDHDPAMLVRAQRILTPSSSPRVRLIEANLTDFEISTRFQLVIIPCNTFAELDRSQAQSCLQAVARHLEPGGVLGLELPQPADAIDPEADPDDPLMAFWEPELKRPVQLYARQAFDPAQKHVDVDWRYDELLPDGHVRSTIWHTRYHLHDRAQITALLSQAGLAAEAFHGDYQGGAFTLEAERMLVIARKT